MPHELEPLNLDDLDLQELESRLELAAAAPKCDLHCECDGLNPTCPTDITSWF